MSLLAHLTDLFFSNKKHQNNNKKINYQFF